MKPSRKLDQMIAEKVMGLVVGYAIHRYHRDGLYHIEKWSEDNPGLPESSLDKNDNCQDYQTLAAFEKKYLGNKKYALVPPMLKRYSSEIQAAWEVVEKMNLLTLESCIWRAGDNWVYGCPSSQTGAGDIRGLSAAHVICLAALKAIGHEVR